MRSSITHLCDGEILLPMMRSVLVLNNQSYQTVSDNSCICRLSFFGHLSRADPWKDHYHALQSCILGPSGDWRWRISWPRQSWLRVIENDLCPLNVGLTTAKRRAQDWSAWRLLVTMATSMTSSWMIMMMINQTAWDSIVHLHTVKLVNSVFIVRWTVSFSWDRGTMK